MDSNPDKHFFDLFMLIIGFLVFVTFGLFLLANYIAGNTQEVYVLQDPVYLEEVDDRIAPVGRVAVDGEAVDNAGEVAEIQQVVEVLTGPQVYNQACVACHGAGVAGAPKTGDATAWAPRLAQSDAILRDHVINGFQGSSGFMPAKGGRADLSDDEIMSAMEYMTDQSR
ncbi:MAG: c-type cytochrome [Gammaproteobacteria bacterium]|nr:c-type cytochrome [Gammaproteobacteria bacterium]